MDLLTTIFTFFLVWWVTLFAVLPMRVETDKTPDQGNDAGAPRDARIKYKMKLNTVIAIIITAVIWGIFTIFGAEIENYYLNATFV